MPVMEEIAELHTSSPRKILEQEIKEIWISENPNRNIEDFSNKPDQQRWRRETQALREDFANRWKVEASKLQPLAAIDAKLGTGLEPVKEKDVAAHVTYRELIERFGDDAVSPFSSKFVLPSDAQPAWKQLVSNTNLQVQRNAANLTSIVATTRAVAGDEVVRKAKNDAFARRSTSPGVDPEAEAAKAKKDWEASELHKSLNGLEQVLADWDKLLAERPLPDTAKLKALADRCDKAFFACYREHVPVYADEASAPFVRYQLLATMRSLSEKVAAQFAARFGTPSFSAAYGLIRDVPLSGTYEASQSTADRLARDYAATSSGAGWNAEKGFATEREVLFKKIGTSDKSVLPALKAELAKLDSAFAASLKTWRKAYQDVGAGDAEAGKKALADLYKSTAEIASGLRNYRQAVDRVLKDHRSSTVQDARKAYLGTLDGFATAISSGIMIGQRLLG